MMKRKPMVSSAAILVLTETRTLSCGFFSPNKCRARSTWIEAFFFSFFWSRLFQIHAKFQSIPGSLGKSFFCCWKGVCLLKQVNGVQEIWSLGYFQILSSDQLRSQDPRLTSTSASYQSASNVFSLVKPPPPAKKDLANTRQTHTQTKSLIPTACLKDGCVQRTGANKTMAGSGRVTFSAREGLQFSAVHC